MTARDDPVLRSVLRSVLRLTPDGRADPRTRPLAIEAPVAVEVNGIGYAVMMATPDALDDFAHGFLLTERLADGAGDILDIDVAAVPDGWIVRATLGARCAPRIGERVRHRTSETACGLCGLSGLEQVRRPAPTAPPPPALAPGALFAALAALRAHQPLNAATGAVHAAAWIAPDGTPRLVREDVGRHNALDKVIGARARGGGVAGDFLLVTSRLSFEMVDKALVAGAGLLAGISAPTTLALDHARAHRLTLVALARADAVLVVNDPHGAFAQR